MKVQGHMGVGGWLGRYAADWLLDMRSKQVPTSTSSARLAALFRPLTAGTADVKPTDDDDEPRGTPPLGPGGPFTCSQCGGAYPTREQLEKHETLHSPNTQTCKICQKSFANVYRLQRHMISHDESALLRKFKCNDCDKAFKFKHHLKEHLRIHSGEKPFGCGNCGKKFSHSGSYSSHMTSKKCLVMNLKMGRIKPNNPALNPERSPSRKRPSAAMVASQLNNNLSPNGNTFMPMLPKYNEAAAAFLRASMSPQDGNFHPQAIASHNVQPFYIPPGMPMSPANGIAPYSLPALSQFFHIASTQYHQRNLESQMGTRENTASSDPEDMIEEVMEDDDKRSSVSSAHELVMDIEDDEAVAIKKEREEAIERRTPAPAYEPIPSSIKSSERENHIGMILDSVNASATKHILQGHMQKLSPVSGTICPTVDSPPAQHVAIKPDPDPVLNCSKCNATFIHRTELLHHEKVMCGNIFRKHEGLAAQVAETLALNRIESELRVSMHSGVSASEDEGYVKEEHEDIMSLQESDRKIRVRTAISEEQQSKLKEHYAVNQRPNREEFKRIAQQLGLDNRVVQVWFQNNRARVRRMNQSLAFSEQPLDLSTKKSTPSVISSPSPSPPCSGVSLTHSDSGEEAVNLSQKSSRSTTPYRSSYQNPYPHSNCSSSSFADFRHSPSPGETLNGHKRMMQHKVMNNFHMLPMEKLLQYEMSASPLLNVHLPHDINRHNTSPGYEKIPWSDEHSIAKDPELDERLSYKKKRAKQGADMKEVEGQYVCDLCDKTFIKQSSLLRHKYEHSGQRPYKCMECDKAFKHKHHLTEHKRLHTGEKPFQCCKCLKKFSHSGSYSQHMNHRYSYCKPYRE